MRNYNDAKKISMRSFEKHAMWHKVVILFSFKKHSLSLFVCSSEATWIRLQCTLRCCICSCNVYAGSLQHSCKPTAPADCSSPSHLKKKKKSSLELLESSLIERNRVREEETDSLTHNELVSSYKQKRKYKKVGCCSLPPGFGICGLKRRDTKRACQIVQGRLAPSPPFLFSCD